MARLARLHSSPMAAAHVGLFSMLTIFGAAPDIAAGCVLVEKRKGEADRIRDKYPDRIPVRQACRVKLPHSLRCISAERLRRR